jgi:hypothetical protein
MADKKRQLPGKIANADGTPTLDFLKFMDDLIYGTDADSIGTLLSGRNTDSAKITGIISGTVSIDPFITDRGKLSGELDAVNANTNSVASSASGSSLTASIDAAFAFASGVGGGAFTTPTRTVTAAGGTAPYTYAWTKVSGDTLTVNSPTAAATTFTGTPGVGNTLQAVYRCTVTDNVAATATVDVSVSITDLTVGI